MATLSALSKQFALLDGSEITDRVLTQSHATGGTAASKTLLGAGIKALLAKVAEKLKAKKITASQLLRIFQATQVFYQEVVIILKEEN